MREAYELPFGHEARCPDNHLAEKGLVAGRKRLGRWGGRNEVRKVRMNQPLQH